MAEGLQTRRIAEPLSPKQVVLQDPRGRPDSVFSRGPHDYEELPGYTRYTPANYPYANNHVTGLHDNGLKNHVHHTGGSVSKQGSASSCEMAARSSNLSNASTTGSEGVYRKRRNPLYDSLPRVDDMDDVDYNGKLHGRVPVCQCICLVVLGILVGVLLVLIVLLLAGMIGAKTAEEIPRLSAVVDDKKLLEALQLIEELKTNYSELQRTVASNTQRQTKLQNDLDTKLLHTNLSSQEALQMNQQFQSAIHSVKAQIGVQNSTVSTLQRDLTEWTNKFSSYKAHVSAQLQNISKMPGPTGPAGPQGPKGDKGAGDLSRCRYQLKYQGTYISSPRTTTPGVPAEDSVWVITGLTCSTDGGEEARLEKINNMFKCTCTGGAGTSSGQRHCYLHIFECPRNS